MTYYYFSGQSWKLTETVSYDDKNSCVGVLGYYREELSQQQEEQFTDVLTSFSTRASTSNSCAFLTGMSERYKLYTAVEMANEQRQLASLPHDACVPQLKKKTRNQFMPYPLVLIYLKEAPEGYDDRAVANFMITSQIQLCPVGITVIAVGIKIEAQDYGHAAFLVIDKAKKTYYGYDPHGHWPSAKVGLVLCKVFKLLKERYGEPWEDYKQYSCRILQMEPYLTQENIEDNQVMGFLGICSYKIAFVVYLMVLFGFSRPNSVQYMLGEVDISLVRKALNGFSQTLLLRHTTNYDFTRKLLRDGVYEEQETRGAKRQKFELS